jgi:hypothetical protein
MTSKKNIMMHEKVTLWCWDWWFINHWCTDYLLGLAVYRWGMMSIPYKRNRCNDSLNRYTIHQSIERFARRWQWFDYSLTSQCALRNRCNDSLNRYTVHHNVVTLYKMLAMFWPLLTIPDKSAIFQKRYNDILNRYNGW